MRISISNPCSQCLGIPISPFLISFLVTSVLCHLIHSSIPQLPPPMNLLDFILGQKEESNIDEEHNQEVSSGNTTSPCSKRNVKISCFVLTICFVALTVTSPYYAFGSFVSKGNLVCKCFIEYYQSKTQLISRS